MIGETFAKRRVGEVIDGRYELKRLLGTGMTGAVYEAHHKYTHQRVAVKVMHQQLLSDDNAVARFLREAKSVAKIGHPAIVEVLDAGETQDRMPYVCLELLHGRTMGRLLTESPRMPFDDVIAIGLDVLGGLAAAHSVGIVHRDMKPDNIFVLEDASGGSRVKILDFGVAKNLQSTGASGVLTKPGATIGTPSYMSPEQARAATIDERTDLWSTGALLFHAAAGRPPFAEASIPALLLKLVTSRPPSLAEVCPEAPAALVRAVDGALDPDLETRFQTADDMAAALRGR
ncbi:MAG: serine/threonine protein kinase [Sandaracinaceae bacterium]|nr:serine/threonine protein kinase [Sandaracinaceae bacterium]